MGVTPSPEQLRESQLAEAAQLRKRYEEITENGIPFSEIDVDDVVTVANRERPEEWYRFRVASIQHGKDTSKPGDPEQWAISSGSGQHYMSFFSDEVFKVVAKRG